MSGDLVALVVGTLLAVVGLGVVLYPLFADETVARPAPPPRERAEVGERERAVEALREIEFDRETGKLSDLDYAELKATYTQEAIAAMRAEESAAVVATAACGSASAAARVPSRTPPTAPRAARTSPVSAGTAAPRSRSPARPTAPAAATRSRPSSIPAGAWVGERRRSRPPGRRVHSLHMVGFG